ncbi:hypothetical protein [Endothiovibrio diazotrophicus]
MDMNTTPRRLADYVFPALAEVEDARIRQSLEAAFRAEDEALATIEAAFTRVTGDYQSAEKLKYFFRSWSMTNNSAMCVSGLGNRMTMQLRDGSELADREALLEAVASLHRISDEDLGAGSATLHWDLYYRMATTICEGDDWQSHRYVTPEAESFKRWKDRAALRDKDLMMGLLSTLVHEVYTHGEVEFVEPMFQQWLATTSDFEPTERKRTLVWITCHCNGTETRHFGHAQQATLHYLRAHGLEMSDYDMEGVFRDYLQRKAAVMASLIEKLDFSPVGRMRFQPLASAPAAAVTA